MRRPTFFIFVLLFAAATFAQSVEQLVVEARAGDTVKKVALRYGADPVEVAKYNGLLPASVLGAGRKIKIPRATTAQPASTCKLTVADVPAVRGLKLGMSKAEFSDLIASEWRDLYNRVD